MSHFKYITFFKLIHRFFTSFPFFFFLSDIDCAAINLNFNSNSSQEGLKEVNKILKIAEEDSSGLKSKKKNNLIAENNSKFPPVELSKFEKNAFNKAKERQINRLQNGTEQIAVGRVYKGAAFVSKPSEILFKDFEIGKKYKKNILFTNTSYTFNSFKLIDLPDSVIEQLTGSLLNLLLLILEMETL